MTQKLLDVLMLGRCSHEFSWPRRAADGHYYQVCLLCAAEYKYDWKTMRRTERVDVTAESGSAPRRRSHAKKPTWVPRARRLKLQIPLRYRVKNLGPQHLPDNTIVEMMFEMPEEISGQKNSMVICQGRVIRAKPPSKSPESVGLAASILDYKFLHRE